MRDKSLIRLYPWVQGFFHVKAREKHKAVSPFPIPESPPHGFGCVPHKPYAIILELPPTHFSPFSP